MYKIDIHVHSSEVSRCSHTSSQDMAIACRNAGYDAIAITDHFYGKANADQTMSWEQRVHHQFEGYRRAKEIGDKIGLKVFAGFEFPDHGSDFLVYGIYEDFLLSHPEIFDIEIIDFLKLIRESGGFIVHAHPLRISKYTKSKGMHLYPEFVDAIEVYNGAQGEARGKFQTIANEYAKFYADQTDLIQTGASDSHNADLLYGGGILTSKLPENVYELIDIIKSRDFTITKE